MATDQGVSGAVVDVDKSFDPGSGLTLDEHRQVEFAKLQQPGFGLRPVPQDNAQQGE